MDTAHTKSPYFTIPSADGLGDLPAGDPRTESFPVAGEDRPPAEGEITVYRAPSGGRVLSCDETDLSGCKVLVADGAGGIVATGEGFAHDPRHMGRSFQRRIDIPPGGTAICLSGDARGASAFYGLAHENAFFHPVTTATFSDLKAVLDAGRLTLSYRPTPLHPGPVADFLFVGNSGIYVYNIPTLFRNMARKAGRNVNADYCTVGGARLSQYADETDALGGRLRALLSKKRYDAVVFHDLSRATAEETHRALSVLVPLVRRNGGTPMLYMRYLAGSLLSEAGWRIDGLSRCYREAGERYGLPVAPAALAYRDCMAAHPEIGLYAEDRDHQSRAGAYLIACVLLRSFLRLDPVGNAFRSGVDPETEAVLQRIARRSCQGAGPSFPSDPRAD